MYYKLQEQEEMDDIFPKQVKSVSSANTQIQYQAQMSAMNLALRSDKLTDDKALIVLNTLTYE